MRSMYFAMWPPWPRCGVNTLSTSSQRRNRQPGQRFLQPGLRWSPVVGELQREALVVLLEQGDRLLEVVLVLAGHPELVALDLGLDLEAGLAHGLGERLGLLLWDPLDERALDPVGAAARGPGLAGLQRLQRDRPAHELLLEDLQGGQRALVGLRDDRHGLARPVDRRPRVLEVEPLGQLLLGLVHRVVDLLPVRS